MYSWLKFKQAFQIVWAPGVLSRYLSSAEVSTALRPFYFNVHPDLFGKYPEQRKTNEYSLQQLSAFIEAQQSKRRITIPPLSFYVRQKDMPEGNFKLVKISLNSNDVRDTVVKVLNACDISTSYIDKIPRSTHKTNYSKFDVRTAYEKYTDDFGTIFNDIKRKVKEKRSASNLIEWIVENSAVAKEKYESTNATRNQVDSLIERLCKSYGIKEVRKYEEFLSYRFALVK